MNKKVLHVVESTATGTLSMLANLANEQAQKGIEVKILYSKRDETPNDLKNLFHKNVELINIQMTGLTCKLKSIVRVRSLVKKIKPNSIFLHSSFAGFIGRISLLGINIKCFYIPHCISFMRKDISKVKELLFVLFEWFGAIKKCDYIACSASEQIEIKRFIPFRKCHLVENAIDTSTWFNNTEWSPRKNIVITVGQIRTQKDPVRFARICEKAKLHNLDFEFIWVGDGDDTTLKNKLLNAGVKVLGWKKPSEVKALLAESKVYLSTALWEGLPVSPLEAMLSGCVVVLSDCSGNRDIINHEENGFSFKTDEDVISVLQSLLHNKDCGERIAKSGFKHANENYSLHRYIGEMDLLIEKDL